MISDELKKIISTFESQGVMNFLDPASEEQISQFEKEKRDQAARKIQGVAQIQRWR